MNNLKLAQIVAFHAFGRRMAYDAKGDLEKVMGEFLSQQLGITDAPKDFFTKAKARLSESLEEEGMKIDLDNSDVYPYIQRVILETADEMGWIK